MGRSALCFMNVQLMVNARYERRFSIRSTTRWQKKESRKRKNRRLSPWNLIYTSASSVQRVLGFQCNVRIVSIWMLPQQDFVHIKSRSTPWPLGRRFACKNLRIRRTSRGICFQASSFFGVNVIGRATALGSHEPDCLAMVFDYLWQFARYKQG